MSTSTSTLFDSTDDETNTSWKTGKFVQDRNELKKKFNQIKQSMMRKQSEGAIIVVGNGMQFDAIDTKGLLRLTAAASSLCTQVSWIYVLCDIILYTHGRVLIVSLLVSNIELEVIASYSKNDQKILNDSWLNLYGSLFSCTTNAAGECIQSSVVTRDVACHVIPPINNQNDFNEFKNLQATTFLKKSLPQRTARRNFLQSVTFKYMQLVSDFVCRPDIKEISLITVGVSMESVHNGLQVKQLFSFVQDKTQMWKFKLVQICRLQQDVKNELCGVPNLLASADIYDHIQVITSGQDFLGANYCRQGRKGGNGCRAKYSINKKFISFG